MFVISDRAFLPHEIEPKKSHILLYADIESAFGKVRAGELELWTNPMMYERHTLCTALGIINCSQAHYDASEGEETRAGRGRAIRRTEVDVEGHQNSIGQRIICIMAIGQCFGVWT